MKPLEGWLAKYTNASVLVKTGQGVLRSVFVTSSVAGVLKLYDNTTNSGTVILDSIAVYPGDDIVLPTQFNTGLYLEVAGALACTQTNNCASGRSSGNASTA